MKHYLLVAFLSFSLSLSAQNVLWNKLIYDVNFMSQLDDGKLLLKDDTYVYLVDHKTGNVDLEYAIDTDAKPQLLEDLPIFFLEGGPFAMIDYATGYIIDESEEKTTILGVSYFWGKRRVIVEMKRKDQLQILNINLKDITSSWTTPVGKVKKKVYDPIAKISEFRPFISNDGKLVVFDQKSVCILHPNGKLLKRLDLKNKLKAKYFNYQKGMVYVLDSQNRLHFIDTKSETNSFVSLNSDKINLKVLGNGSNISFIQGNTLWIVDAVSGTMVGKNRFLDKIKMTYVDKSSGKLYALTRRQLAEINLNSAKIARDVSFEEDMNEIRKVHDKTVINGNSWASPINLETFELQYPRLPDIPAIHDYVELDNGTGYIYDKDNRFKFHVVDDDGFVLWNENFTSVLAPSLDVIGKGVLIINESKVQYLSVKNGDRLWQEDVRVDNSFTYGIDEETNDLYMYSQKRLYRFDHAEGTLSKSEDKFRFRDFDYQFQVPLLFVLEDAIFLKGSNSIFVLNKDGTIRHKKSYSRISNGSTILDLVNVAVVAIAIGTGNINELSVIDTESGIYVGSLVDPLDLSASIASDMRFDRREKQNRGSDVYPYVFTHTEVGKRGFIFLDAATGDERFEIPVESKSPNYIVDEYDGILFHLRENELVAYDVK